MSSQSRLWLCLTADANYNALGRKCMNAALNLVISCQVMDREPDRCDLTKDASLLSTPRALHNAHNERETIANTLVCEIYSFNQNWSIIQSGYASAVNRNRIRRMKAMHSSNKLPLVITTWAVRRQRRSDNGKEKKKRREERSEVWGKDSTVKFTDISGLHCFL